MRLLETDATFYTDYTEIRIVVLSTGKYNTSKHWAHLYDANFIHTIPAIGSGMCGTTLTATCSNRATMPKHQTAAMAGHSTKRLRSMPSKMLQTNW